MATITKTVTENMTQRGKATWTVTHTGSNITVTGSSFTFTTPTVTAKYVYSGRSYGMAYDYLRHIYIGGIEVSQTTGHGWSWAKGTVEKLVAMSSGTAYTIPKVTSYNNVTYEAHTKTLQTSTFFNSTNKNARSLNITASNWYPLLLSGSQKYPDNGYNTEQTGNIGTLATVTLNAPPTFNSTDVTLTGSPYAGYVTATATISNLSAKYGGDISSAVLKIGNQTATITTNGSFKPFTLTTAGTFTPTVTVTDSRGQVTIKNLAQITVLPYVAPNVSFNIERTTDVGVLNDEGESAVITATLTYTDAVASLTAPTIVVKDTDNITITPTITWYTDRALTDVISESDWSSVASGAEVYALLGNDVFDTQDSYQISLTPNDIDIKSEPHSGTTITQMLGSAFYTVDFRAGGHGIAFGQACTADGFYCNMDTYFETGNVYMSGHISPIGTVKYAQLTSNKSVPNNTGTMLTSISLEAGVWVIVCGVRWATNNNGYRRMNLATVSGATDIQYVVHPVQGEWTQAIFTRILEVKSTTTYYLNAYQNSGSAINAIGAAGTNYGTYITAVRII